MRQLPEGLLEGSYGSLSEGRMEFTCWYDGSPVITTLPYSDWNQTFRAGQQVNGATSITVQDDSGELAPWGVDEPLGVGGSIIQSRLCLDTLSIPLGRQRLTSSDTTEVWRLGPDGKIWIASGAVIEVLAEDMTIVVAGDKFVTPEAPLTGSTAMGEIRRLMQGIMDVTFEDTIADVLIPPSLTYNDERMDAVEDLISAMGCRSRVTGTGQLAVYKPDKEIVWVVEGGALSTQSLIGVTRSQSISDLKNLIVARNTLQGGVELQAATEERSGPLRTDGPHGRWPEFIQADFATNQYEIEEAAYQTLQARLRGRTTSIPLTTIFHPGLELGDYIQVNIPVTSGDALPLPGRVTSISYAGPRVPLTMALTLECELSDIQRISERLRMQRWSA